MLVYMAKSPEMIENIKNEFELGDSEIIVTSQTRKEIEKMGMNYDSIINSISEQLGVQITNMKITKEIKQNSKFLNETFKSLHCGDDAILAAAITTKSTLITADQALVKCAKKAGCQVKMVQEGYFN
jgi:rRNA-processing protein FCF1